MMDMVSDTLWNIIMPALFLGWVLAPEGQQRFWGLYVGAIIVFSSYGLLTFGVPIVIYQHLGRVQFFRLLLMIFSGLAMCWGTLQLIVALVMVAGQ